MNLDLSVNFMKHNTNVSVQQKQLAHHEPTVTKRYKNERHVNQFVSWR